MAISVLPTAVGPTMRMSGEFLDCIIEVYSLECYLGFPESRFRPQRGQRPRAWVHVCAPCWLLRAGSLGWMFACSPRQNQQLTVRPICRCAGEASFQEFFQNGHQPFIEFLFH